MQSTIAMYIQQSLQLADDALRLAHQIEQQIDPIRPRERLWRF